MWQETKTNLPRVVGGRAARRPLGSSRACSRCCSSSRSPRSSPSSCAGWCGGVAIGSGSIERLREWGVAAPGTSRSGSPTRLVARVSFWAVLLAGAFLGLSVLETPAAATLSMRLVEYMPRARARAPHPGRRSRGCSLRRAERPHRRRQHGAPVGAAHRARRAVAGRSPRRSHRTGARRRWVRVSSSSRSGPSSAGSSSRSRSPWGSARRTSWRVPSSGAFREGRGSEGRGGGGRGQSGARLHHL